METSVQVMILGMSWSASVSTPVKKGYHLTDLMGKKDVKWYVWQPSSNIRLPMIIAS